MTKEGVSFNTRVSRRRAEEEVREIARWVKGGRRGEGNFRGLNGYLKDGHSSGDKEYRFGDYPYCY